MANTSSAKKANRVENRRRVFNLRRAKAMKDAVRAVEKGATKDALSAAFQAIDKAAKRGLIKKNTAARIKSRLSKKVK